MRCEPARAALSARFDGEPTDVEASALDAHLDTCAACRGFESSITSIRHGLRFEAVAPESVPDVAPAVVAAIRRGDVVAPASRHRRAWLVKAAAVFVVGAVAGAAFVGITYSTPDSAYADLPAAVSAAQVRVDSLSASVHVVEHGYAPAVPTRTFAGALRYRAPESLLLTLHDTTKYPSAAWVPDDVTAAIDGTTAWTSGPHACPTEALPGCTPTEPATTVVTNREPFAVDTSGALDLITPVTSLGTGGEPMHTGTAVVAGRAALGVQTTAARVAPLLAALAPAGNLRAVYPGDTAEVWLDRETFIPLSIEVRTGRDPDRASWASTRGYADQPGAVILAVTLSNVSVNAGAAVVIPPLPTAGVTIRRDDGFTAGGAGPGLVPTPTNLPAGFTPYRSGTVLVAGGPTIGVRTWTDGRGWLSVRATHEWKGDRLFGDLGAVVRQIVLPSGATAYESADGTKIALHSATTDIVVAGSVSSSNLVAVAASLGVDGTVAPSSWRDASSASPAGAVKAYPTVAQAAKVSGFDPPAVRVDHGTVTLDFFGGGDLYFELTRAATGQLLPPMDPDVRGVRVRGVDGRYLPSLGRLEWVESGHAYRLDSSTLSLGELLAIAARLPRS